MKKVNIVPIITAVALLGILIIVIASRINQPVTVLAPEPHPSLTWEERALLSEMLAEMYGTASDPEPVETGPIALQVKPSWEPDPKPTPTYTEEELEILAIIIYQEAGGDAASDETRLRVGNVFLNRVADDRFPDTFEEVATQHGQYGTLSWTGLRWPDRAVYEGEAHAVQRAYDIARRLLEGERVLPDDVIFQSEYIMGEIVAYSDGHYFCR